MRPRRLLLTTLLLILLLVGVPAWLTYRAVRQERLDRALIEAIKKDEAQTAIALLDAGADANAQDVPPQSPSLWKLLLNRLHGKRTQPRTGPSALLVALEWRRVPDITWNNPHYKHPVIVQPKNNPSLIRALLTHGANANAKVVTSHNTNTRGTTPLLLALEQRKEATARLLIQYGADVNAQDSFGLAPLMMADTEALVTLLLDYRANLNAKNMDGTTVLMLQAGFPDHLENVRLLVENGADVKAANIAGDTALHYAAEGDNKRILTLLLDKGANVNAQDHEGYTPLLMALRPPALEDVRVLLAHGADVALKSKNGETALADAKSFLVGSASPEEQKQYRRIIQLLKQAGAKE